MLLLRHERRLHQPSSTDGLLARAVHTALQNELDVFFDRREIDYGDNVPQKITDALAECRVVLVLIGPRWLEPASLKRLRDEKNWVRREIVIGLNNAAFGTAFNLYDVINETIFNAGLNNYGEQFAESHTNRPGRPTIPM